MSLVFDPIRRLTSVEAFRAIGTIGDITKDAAEFYIDLLELFVSREMRNANEIIQAIVRTGRKKTVASNTLEVASGLGLVSTFSVAQSHEKKYMLAELGRVINAMRSHEKWSSKKSTLMMRPMFESHGDYLLQALQTISESASKSDAVDLFRELVIHLSDSKMKELPSQYRGAKWDSYVNSLRYRRSLIQSNSDRSALDGEKYPTLNELQKMHMSRLREMQLGQEPSKKSVSSSNRVGEISVKTFQDHFERCRGWLVSLRLVEASRSAYYCLTPEGNRVLEYFASVSSAVGPARIPPSLAILQDCFRVEKSVVRDHWGAVVDEAFWEDAWVDRKLNGHYTPTENELVKRFEDAFSAVRLPMVTEADILSVRQYMFYTFWWDGRPVSSEVLDDALTGPNSVVNNFPDKFAYGRSRQGRLSYIFRKKR